MGIRTVMFLEAAAESKTSFGTAILNTIMGIVIVFVMLIIISWIIGLFKYISKIEDYFKNKNQSTEPVKENITEPAPAIEEEDYSDDLELAAVITAAIYAYEEENGGEVPADGLVVRSIKKVNKSKWQNA